MRTKEQTKQSTQIDVKKIVYTALLAALTCVATMVIHIPTPTNGYVNIGDGFVILSAILLGPLCGFLAGGIGSMLADLISGYVTYIPGTFLIKGFAALLCALVYNFLKKKLSAKFAIVAVVVSAIVVGAVVTLGYFIYEATFLQYGLGAISSIPGNLCQNVIGLIIAILLYPIANILKKQMQ